MQNGCKEKVWLFGEVTEYERSRQEELPLCCSAAEAFEMFRSQPVTVDRQIIQPLLGLSDDLGNYWTDELEEMRCVVWR